LTLITVVAPPHPSIGRDLNPRLHEHETLEHQTEHAAVYLNAVAQGLRAEGLSVATVTPSGLPWQVIVEEAQQTPDTLIAMSSHGRSGTARWWLGSVADRVLHLTTGPILVVRSHHAKEATHSEGFNRVIVPVDGSLLAEEILPHVAQTSKGLGLAVDLVRVMPTSEHLGLAVPRGLHSDASFESASRQANEEATEYLERLKEGLLKQGVGPVEVHLLHGDPASLIIDLASETPDRLVAMTTHGRSGVGRWMLGSVADRVIRNSGDPVLLVRAAESTTSQGQAMSPTG
jgi:nucleotide-binding universal stress UspA family protein